MVCHYFSLVNKVANTINSVSIRFMFPIISTADALK